MLSINDESDSDNEDVNFNLLKRMGAIQEADDSLLQFLSSDENPSSDENTRDYQTQIEDNEVLSEWWNNRQNQNTKSIRNSSNLKRNYNEFADVVNIEKQEDNESTTDTDNETEINTDLLALKMDQQNTSGLDINKIRESQLFREYRIIGLVCNHVPFAFQKLGNSFFIATSIGKSFQIYEGKTLRLKLSSQTTNATINALLINHELTFLAVENTVQLWFRVHKVLLFVK